jgi:hypothetical protein
MYLRHTTITKHGKTHTYWRLVRSVRHGRKIRQETVAQLGKLDEKGRLAARALAETAFRVQKESLQLPPVWHQTAERVTAHILVCFLAYVLRKALEGWCQRAGLCSSTTTVLEEMARIQGTDVVMPTQDRRQIRLRCVVRPDRAQAILLDRLGLILPQRLRLPRGLPDPTSDKPPGES